MGHDVANEQDLAPKVDLGNQPVLVSAYIEDYVRRNEVSRVERPPYFEKVRPCCALRHAIPIVQRAARLVMLFTEQTDGLMAHNSHRRHSDGPIMGLCCQGP